MGKLSLEPRDPEPYPWLAKHFLTQCCPCQAYILPLYNLYVSQWLLKLMVVFPWIGELCSLLGKPSYVAIVVPSSSLFPIGV